jgi:hypothetical protein
MKRRNMKDLQQQKRRWERASRPLDGSRVRPKVMTVATIHVLLVTPIIFFIVKRYQLKHGTLRLSGLRATEELATA